MRGCLQLNLVEDGNLQGIIFDPYRQVYVHHHDELLAYRLDLSIIYDVMNKSSLVQTQCQDRMGMEGFKNITFKEYLDEWQWTLGLIPENGTITDIVLPEIELVKKLAKLPNDCYDAAPMAANVQDALKLIDELSKYNTSSDFVKHETLRKDVVNLMANQGDTYITPFKYDEFFLKNFEQYARAQYFYQESAVYLVYQIPLYVNNLFMLYMVHPKPIIFNHDAYIYGTNNSFSIFENTKLITYTKQQYIDNCFETRKSVYCQRPHRYDYINYCDQIFLVAGRGLFAPRCFSKLPNRNMVTEINKKLFFTIFYPMDIYITHNTLTYPLRLSRTAKLTGTIDVSVNGTFFYFSPDGSNQYKIFVDEGVNPDEIYFSFDFKKRDLSLFFIIIILIIAFIVIPVTIHCSNKIKYGKIETENDKKPENKYSSETYMAYTEF